MPVALDVNTIRRATLSVEQHKMIRHPKNLLNFCETIVGTHLTLTTYTLKLTPPNCAHTSYCVSEADLIIRGNRLVIPTKLRQQVISLAHEGHQGLIKTKKLLREKVWFPKIDTLTERMSRLSVGGTT